MGELPTDSTAETFAANRARGRIVVTADGAAGVTRRRRVHEDGSLRIRFPNGDGRDLEAVVINTAGGVAGGDRFAFDLAVEDGGCLTLTTAAAEKTYRSHGPDSVIDVSLTVGNNATLRWLPQETILFDQARLSRKVDINLTGNGTLLLAEAVVFGRTAMGETVASGMFTDRWRVRRNGRLAFAETVKLDGAIASQLSQRAVAAGGAALATVLLSPGDDTAVAAVRALEENFAGEVGASAWNGQAVMRLCATDGARLRHDLMMILSALSDRALPRLWLN